MIFRYQHHSFCKLFISLSFFISFLLSSSSFIHAATYQFNDTVTYSWINTTTTVSWTESACTDYPIDDDAESGVSLGFTFTYGGVNYTSVRIISNGALHFGADQGFHKDYTIENLPIDTSLINGPCAESLADRVIAPYWADFAPDYGGTVNYDIFGIAPNRRFVASWNGVPEWGGGNNNTVQVILYEGSNNIKFQYDASSDADGAGAAIGVEIDNTDSSQYSFNTASVGNNGPDAILFYDTHFAITHDGSGTTSIPEPITITTHIPPHTAYTGLNNGSDTNTITLNTSTAHGDWSISSGSGTLINNGSGNATYTFAAADNGQVILDLTNTFAETLSIDITSQYGSEDVGEDPNLTFTAPTIPHFAISHDGSGNSCAPENITITKHTAVHATDTGYIGTITLSTSTAHGDWSVVSGTPANLTNSGNGDATYTYDATDNGQIILGLANTFTETLNINITDGSDSEDPAEDANMVFSNTVTETFRDYFNISSFSNNDGTVNWAADWIEVDGDGAGPGTGNVLISGGNLSLDDRPNTGGQPSLEREADLTTATSASLSFNYQTTGGVDSSDSIIVEISANGGGAWTTLENFTGIVGSSSGSRNYDVSAYMSVNTRIRFRVANLYGGPNEEFLVDFVQIQISSPLVCPADHISISHDGAASRGIAEEITITSHYSDHTTATGYTGTITLSTSTAHGDWSVISGTPANLTNMGNGDAIYIFDAADTGQVILGLLNSFSETLNIDVTDGTISEDPSEDNDLVFSDIIPPTITSSSISCSTNELTLVFSESVDQTTAETSTNYTLDNGATVISASRSATNTVTLTTSAMSDLLTYTLTVNNVEDLAGNPITPGTTELLTKQCRLKLESATVTLPITTSGIFTTVNFQQTYSQPPVVVVLPAGNRTDPADNPSAIRVRNITTTGFEMAQVEPFNEDGNHTAMIVHYLAVTQGRFTLPDGTAIESGFHTTTTVQHGNGVVGAEGYDAITFNQPFTTAPVVLSHVQTMNNEVNSPPGAVSSPWLTTAINSGSITTTGFSLALERSEVNNDSVTVAEQIGYIAIDPNIQGSFTDTSGGTVTYETITTGNTIRGWGNGCYTTNFINTYTATPNVLANKRGHQGGDGGWLRRCSISTTQVGLTVDEDRDRDNERNHIAEPVSIAVFSNDFVADFSFSILGYWYLDEASWNGTNGEVADSGGNNHNGTAVGNATTTTGQVCNGGTFDGAGDYVTVPHNVQFDVADKMSFSIWAQARSTGTYKILQKGDWDGHGVGLDQWNGWETHFRIDGATYRAQAGVLPTLNQWYHIVGIYDGTAVRLYIDGSPVASTPIVGALNTNTRPIVIGSDITQKYFDGLIDEAIIYSGTLTASDISTIYTNQAAGLNIDGSSRTCSASCTLGSYSISIPVGNTLTCAGNSAGIGITALCTDGVTTKTDYAGNVTLSTSSNHGDWSKTTATNTPVNGTADDGAATHQFDTTDNGYILLDLANQHADDLTVTVADGTVSSTSASFSYRDNVFVVTPSTQNGSPLSTTEVVVGRDHSFDVALWTKNPATGTCEIATRYNETTNNVYAWYTPDAAHPGGAAAPSINGQAMGTTQGTAKNITFTNGAATPVLQTTDVGKYVLNIKDASGFAKDITGAPLVVQGSSNTLTVRPFGLRIDTASIQSGATSNPAAADANGAKFISAGTTFQADITAVTWQTGDDADSDGIPDNGTDLSNNTVVPAFAWNTAVTHTRVAPIAGATGILSNGGVVLSNYTNGTATDNDLAWDEVGIITLTPHATAYLGGADIEGVPSVNIGRFIPDHFEVTGNSPILADNCVAAGNFTYLGESFVYLTGPSITITAQNADNTTTTNYEGSFWKLGEPFSMNYSYTDNNAGVPALTPSTTTYTATAGATTNCNGSLVVTPTNTFIYDRPAAASPQAPFGADIDMDVTAGEFTDTDSVCYKTGIPCLGLSIAAISGANLRHGRIKVYNNYGPETENITNSLYELQYYDGTNWIVNVDDSCTNEASLSYCADPATHTVSLDAGSLSAGAGTITVNKDAGETAETVRVCPTAPASLTSLSVCTAANVMCGDFTFGLFRGNDRIINWQEIVR